MNFLRSPLAGLPYFLLLAASPLGAQAPLLSGLGGEQDYGENCLHRNDDQTSRSIDLTAAFPEGLRFFDGTFTEVFVNTNGNITFGGGVRQYTPAPFPLERMPTRPMIAPFWADIDTRRSPGATECRSESTGTCSGGDNSVWWHLEPNRMVVTWHDVGYFNCNNDLRMNFQLLLTGVPSCGGGATDFNVEFRFNRCEWETGDASSGSGGFGGTPAQAGFDAGNGTDFVAIPGSRTAGIAEALCAGSNVDDVGVWRFQIRSGTVLCPEAGESCDTGMTGVCGEGVTQCLGMGTECAPVVPASDETCDAVDNDCDGNVDEGDDLCESATAVCDRGSCVDVCFEGGCPEGQTCTDAGRCVPAGCEDIECPEGQRCEGGECIDACGAVTCPHGLDCRGGLCLDLCAELRCDPECSVCASGECVPRCDLPGSACAPGETCVEGLCEATECVGVACMSGQVCIGERGCVDACEGAVCPRGESCVEGACERVMTDPEPPPPEAEDAGMVDTGSGGNGDVDAGKVQDAGIRIVPRESGGCGCRVTARGGSAHWVVLALLGFVLRRKRSGLLRSSRHRR